MAAAYGNLVKKVFLGSENAVSPWDFKKMIAKKAPLFSGYSQQDSMELLSYLLDGLHEDLNQIKEKPILPSIDLESEENPEENASKFWSSHLQRNKSKLVDLIYGQYKSKITCSKCRRISVTYDPFSIVTLPVGASSEINKCFSEKFCAYFIPKSLEQKPTKIIFEDIQHKTTLKEITEAIKQQHSSSPELLEFIYLKDFTIANSIPADSNITAKKLYEDNSDHLLFVYDVSPPSRVQREYSNSAKRPIGSEEPEAIEEELKDEIRVKVEILRKGKAISFPRFYFARLSDGPVDFLALVYQNIRPALWEKLGLNSALSSPKKAKEELALLFSKDSRKKPFRLFVQKYSEKVLNEAEITSEHSGLQMSDWVSEHETFGKIVDLRVDFLLEDMKLNKCDSFKVKIQKKETRSSKYPSLLSCLELFSEAEVLDGDNQWYCSRCKKHVDATKEMNIWKASKYLILQLNRFKIHRIHSYGKYYMGGSTTKNSDYVEIPVDGVDLSKFILETGSGKSKIYDLIAVSNHYGSYGGGHYTATVRHYKGKWIYCNDSSVSSGPREIGAEAYLLIYRRRD